MCIWGVRRGAGGGLRIKECMYGVFVHYITSYQYVVWLIEYQRVLMIVDVHSFHSVVALFTLILRKMSFTTILVKVKTVQITHVVQAVLLGVSKQYASSNDRQISLWIHRQHRSEQWNRNALDFDLHLIPPGRGPSLPRTPSHHNFPGSRLPTFLRSIVTNGILISVNRKVISPTYVVQYCIFYFNHRARGCRCYTQLQMLKEPCAYVKMSCFYVHVSHAVHGDSN